jgi:hypothetical protein
MSILNLLLRPIIEI